MECLRNRIGINGCGHATPDSGLTINSLPGISLESIDKLAKSEQSTYVKVWDDVQTRALQKFEASAISIFSRRYRKKSLKQSIDLGKIIKADVSAMTPQYRGFSAEANLTSDAWSVSNLQGISWQSLSLYLSSVPASPIVLKIWDMETGEVLWSKTVNNASNPVSAGFNVISVNKIFMPALRLFAGYDSTEIDSVLLNVNPSLSSSFQGCCCRIWGCSCEAHIRGAQTIVNTDPTLLSYGSNSYGLSGVFSVICSFEPLICNNKKQFDNSLWYFLGAEMMIERLYSPRWNWWTLEQEEAQKLLNYYIRQGDEILEQVIDGIDLDLNDGCIECNQQVTIREMTP
jgi:hypothetical protein